MIVNEFARKNFLKLNLSKCEVVVFTRSQQGALPVCEVEGSVLPASGEGKCLGFWWKGDLLATRAVEENIKKARRAFFHYGSIGIFQGDLSPLSSRQVLEMCVLPVLLYGSENWIMTENLLGKLESFQAELVKRILKWPKHFSNTAAITVLDVLTMECRVLERKLSFLQHVMGGKASDLSSLVKESFCDEISSLCLVKECRDLEEAMQTEFTEGILKGRLWGPDRGRRRYRR